MFVAVVNQKGGVGKTTLAVHLAMWFTEQGRRVALVDTDEQRTASRWLAEADRRVTVVAKHQADELIERAPGLSGSHDVVIADGPANLAECTRALLLVADLAVIPCGPTVPELESTGATVRILRNAQAVRGGQAPTPLLVFSRLRPARYRLSRDALEAAHTFGIPVARHIVPLREAIADAPGQRTAVWRLGSQGRDAAHDIILLLQEIAAYAEESTQRLDGAHSGAGGIPASAIIGAGRNVGVE